MQLDLPQRWSKAAPMVLPVLRGPTSPSNAWLTALDRADAIGTRRAVAPNLDLVAVLDLPEMRVFINQGHLDKWGVDPDQVLQQALSNLPPATGLERWGEFEQLWSLNAGDGYESSRLALPGFLQAFADKVPGRPIAVAPDAHTLLIAGTDSGEALHALVAEGWNRFHSAGTPISPSPYTIDDDGRLCRWNPGLSEPLAHRVQACHRFHAGHEYRQQQTPLEQWLKGKGSPDRLQVFSMIRHRAGRVVTFSTWHGQPSLLPAVDLVFLLDSPEQDLATAPCVTWAELQARAVITDAEPLLRPERYRVDRFPAGYQDWPTVDANRYVPYQ